MAVATITAAATAATMATSFTKAAKQRRAARKAQRHANKSIKKAMKELSKNQYDALGIAKEPYRLAREAALVSAQMGLQAAQEAGPRVLAGAAGAIHQANQMSQQQVSASQEREIQRIEELKAKEEAHLAEERANVLKDEATGAQEAAENQEAMANQSMMQGFAGAASLVGQAAAAPALYGQGAARQAVGDFNKLTGDGARIGEALQQEGVQGKLSEILGPTRLAQFQAVDPANQADWLRTMMTPEEMGLFNQALTRGVMYGAGQQAFGALSGINDETAKRMAMYGAGKQAFNTFMRLPFNPNYTGPAPPPIYGSFVGTGR